MMKLDDEVQLVFNDPTGHRKIPATRHFPKSNNENTFA